MWIRNQIKWEIQTFVSTFQMVRLLKNQNLNTMNEIIPPPVPQPKTSALAIGSLVLGILGLMCFTIFAAIPGVICGHKALSKIQKSDGSLSGKGLAIAGLITGYLGIAWAVIFIPMLMAIAIPNFVKARNVAIENACINNLRQIEAAKSEYGLWEKIKPAAIFPPPKT